MRNLFVLAAFILCPTVLAPAAAQQHDHGAMEGGAPGNPAEARRTVEITATDNQFDLKSLRVAAGETIRFMVRNKGALLHEFTLGAPAMQIEHQQEMERLLQQGAITTIGIDAKKLAAAGHRHGNSVLIEPGKQAVLVWRFAKDGVLEFACNIPGHYQAGMHGDITIQ